MESHLTGYVHNIEKQIKSTNDGNPKQNQTHLKERDVAMEVLAWKGDCFFSQQYFLFLFCIHDIVGWL